MLEFKEYDKVIMHVLVSPGGCIQLGTMSPILEESVGFIGLQHMAGIGFSYEGLLESGYTMEKVEVTIKRIKP